MPAADEAISPEEIVDYMVTYQVPEEYKIGVIIIGFAIALFAAYVFTKHKWRKQLTDNGLTKEQYPFGADHMLNIIVNGVIGGFAAYFGAGILLGLMGHQDAPGEVYYFFAFIFGCVVGYLGWQFLRKIVDDKRSADDNTAEAVAAKLTAETAHKQ